MDHADEIDAILDRLLRKARMNAAIANARAERMKRLCLGIMFASAVALVLCVGIFVALLSLTP